MTKTFWFTAFSIAIITSGVLSVQAQREIRSYTANKVSDAPPVMDGVVSAGEWDDGEVATGYFGLDNQGSNGANAGQPVELNWSWRMVWDDDYLYILFEGESFDLPINGIIEDQIVEGVVADDQVYSFAVGVNHDLEVYLEPNWQDGDGFNSDPPAFTDSGGAETDGYHFIYWLIQNDEDFTEANEGVRDGINNIEGPPYIFHEANYDSTFVGGTAWNLTSDPALAAENDALPFLVGGSLNMTGEAPGSASPFAFPVVEMAIPFTQLTPAFGLPESSADGETNLTVTEVNPGDEWLVNPVGYTDPFTAANGLTLATWSNAIGGPFASYPRGVMTFSAGTVSVKDWMVLN